jgi:hypothetical protein
MNSFYIVLITVASGGVITAWVMVMAAVIVNMVKGAGKELIEFYFTRRLDSLKQMEAQFGKVSSSIFN